MRVVGRILADCMVSQRSQYSATVGVVLRKTASSIWRCASSTFSRSSSGVLAYGYDERLPGAKSKGAVRLRSI